MHGLTLVRDALVVVTMLVVLVWIGQQFIEANLIQKSQLRAALTACQEKAKEAAK